jgi:putative ABC transport system ATP-binding protein
MLKVAAKTEWVIYMLDGKITAEVQLDKYKRENNDGKEREEKLSKWLICMGF